VFLLEQVERENYEEFLYSELQLKKSLIEPESKEIKNFNQAFIKDLILTNFNEVDIFTGRGILGSMIDFNLFGLGNVANEILLPNLFSIVNTARSRGGFERKALITQKRDESSVIKATQNSSLWEKLRGKGR